MEDDNIALCTLNPVRNKTYEGGETAVQGKSGRTEIWSPQLILNFSTTSSKMNLKMRISGTTEQHNSLSRKHSGF